MVFGSPDRQLWHTLFLLCGAHRSEQLLLQIPILKAFFLCRDLSFYEAETGLFVCASHQGDVSNMRVLATHCLDSVVVYVSPSEGVELSKLCQVFLTQSFTNANPGGFHLDKKNIKLDSEIQGKNAWPLRAKSSGTFICQSNLCDSLGPRCSRGSLSWLTQYMKALATRKMLFRELQLGFYIPETTHINQ